MVLNYQCEGYKVYFPVEYGQDKQNTRTEIHTSVGHE